MVLVLVFLALVLIRLVVMGFFLLLIVSVGPGCPACGGETILVRSYRLLRRIRRLERRWCLGCEWEGMVRRGPSRQVEAAVPETRQPRPA